MFGNLNRENEVAVDAAQNSGKNHYNKYTPQSGTTADNNIGVGATMSKHQNIMFRDQNPSYTYDVLNTMDPTRRLQDSSDATLENFFSRPLKISEQEWSTSSSLGYDFDPWDLYFSNPRVINRISNFKLMRATLKLKVVINGNGFQYGRAIMAYLPLDSDDQLSTLSSLVRQDLVQTSQLPHVYLDPTTSSGGELTCPFFYDRNYVDLPTAQYRNLGRIYVRSLNDLKHANGATDVVTISIFAWAEDVALSVLTSREPSTIVPQSGEEVDEANKTGVVSGPATMIAKVSNAMAMVPAITPFAKATEQIANTTATIAKSFGYCRPPVTKNPEPFRPANISSLAVTTVPDTAQKLTVDDKQELTIDPRIAGIGPADPLSIRDIAKRESYLTSFTWAIGSAPETLLWNARVDPVTWAENAGPPQSFHFPACAMAALPFKYWTGTMKFRFQIVCSSFHKGRLKFVYDPEFLASNEYNTNYIEIVDIADTQDFTLEVGVGQDLTLLDHHLPGIDSVTQMYSTTAYSSKEEGNGVVGVYIVNELTTPNSAINNDIEINVFVSMGDDFEVFVPDDHFQKFVFKPQSGSEGMVPEAQNTEEPSAPQQKNSDQLGPGMQDTTLINSVFTGEAIMSFRPLLKRYSIWRSEIPAVGVNGLRIWKTRKSMFPFLRGNVAGAVDVTGLAAPYNYCNTLLLHWVVGAFQGWRGSIRYKIFWRESDNSTSTHSISQLHWQREDDVPSGTAIYREKVDTLTATSRAQWSQRYLLGFDQETVTGAKGMVYTDPRINGATEIEIPYYSEYRFQPGKKENYSGTSRIKAPTFIGDHLVFMSNTNSLDYLTATGEDFQVFFFTGLPRMYYENIPPAG